MSQECDVYSVGNMASNQAVTSLVTQCNQLYQAGHVEMDTNIKPLCYITGTNIVCRSISFQKWKNMHREEMEFVVTRGRGWGRRN